MQNFKAQIERWFCVIQTAIKNVTEKVVNWLRIKKFQQLPHYKQKTQQWLEQRNHYLTASTIASAIGLMGPVARENVLKEKVSYGKLRSFFGNTATRWGVKYEPVAKAIYSHRNNTKVYDLGFVTNQKYPILGISPDGITVNNLLEIKCPYSRVIDGKIKKDYHHQMQAQMTVCEFSKCDFLECKFEAISESEFQNDFPLHEKGIIITYYNISERELDYLYSPVEYNNNIALMKQWEQKTISELQRSSNKVYRFQTYWYLKTYLCQTVKHDPQWVIDYYPVLQKFWEEIEYYREMGTEFLLNKIQENRATRERAKILARAAKRR